VAGPCACRGLFGGGRRVNEEQRTQNDEPRTKH
jgi:hypothetical protein